MALLAQLTEQLSGAESKNDALCRERHYNNMELRSLEEQIATMNKNLQELLQKKERIDTEQKATLASIKEMRVCIAALATKPLGRVWRVSDCHAHCTTGAWALEATESGTYGICVPPCEKNDGANQVATLINGERAKISKRRYANAAGISVGDTLYMGDLKRAKVFKGIITGQSVKGLFRSSDPSVNSFRRRVKEREDKMGKSSATFRPLEEEIEMMWEVKWEPVGHLNHEWKLFLNFSQRTTVVPISPETVRPA